VFFSIGTCRHKLKNAEFNGRWLKINLKYRKKKSNKWGERGEILTVYIIKKVYLPSSP